MGHGITKTDTFSFTGARGNIWHRMGKQIPEGQTAVEALPSVGLDWPTTLAPVFADVANLGQVPLPDHRAHIRQDTGAVLGLVSDGYVPMQNRETAAFADSLVDPGTATLDTAGSLLGGRRVFFALRFVRPITLGRGGVDVVQPYLVTSNGHGGFASLNCYTTTVRVVCQNTLSASERDLGTGVRLYHTGDMQAKLLQAKVILGAAATQVEMFGQQLRALANHDMTSAQVRAFFEAAFATSFGGVPKEADAQGKWLAKREKHVSDWLARFENERQTLPGIQGTAWAAVNAYTEWADHDKGGTWAANRGDEVRFHNNVFGVAAASKRKVFQQALALL
jgi:phage/plasmid-like protein (TIGR03299 family)